MLPLSACAGCGLHHQCVCDLVPHFDTSLHIALLMHENELNRETNTGQWLLKAIPSTSQHIWQRKVPCPQLMALINNEQYQPYLVFPSDQSLSLSQANSVSIEAGKTPLFIILDGTWQEAGKMLRKSVWLAGLPCVHLQPSEQSNYQLRRNQQQGHLCTLEVGAEIIKSIGLNNEAKQLDDFFCHYMRVFKADKSGHTLKL